MLGTISLTTKRQRHIGNPGYNDARERQLGGWVIMLEI
jgi:hypothetical protein